MSGFEFTFSIAPPQTLLKSSKRDALTFPFLPLSQTFQFLRLPPELRNKVYRLLLVSDKTFTVGLRFGSFDTSLLTVNRQIHQEASGIFYEENTFRIPQSLFVGPHILDQLDSLYRLSRSRLAQLRSLIVEIPVYGPYLDHLFYQQVVLNVWTLVRLLRDGRTPLKIEVNLVEPWVEKAANLQSEYFLANMRPWTSLWMERRLFGAGKMKITFKIVSKSPHLWHVRVKAVSAVDLLRPMRKIDHVSIFY